MSTEPETLQDISDLSKNIRTYAKDYVTLSGKNPESGIVSAEVSKQKKVKEPKIKIPKVKPVKKPKPVKIKEVKPKKQKEVPLKEPTIKQDLISTESELPLKDQERLAILERLKARVASGDVHLEPPQIPTLPTEKSPLVEIVSPPPLIIPKPQSIAAEPSPIHTYKSDFADEIDAKHASKFSVLAAEKDAPTKKTPPSPPRRSARSPILLIVIGIILLLGGAGALAAAYMYVVKNTPAPLVLGPASLISYDNKIQLSGSGEDLLTQLAQKADAATPVNSVLLTYIDESTTTPQGVTEEPATGGAFISELNLQAPNILLRNINPDSMVGVVHAGNESRAFFILKVDSYQSTFAGMLQWEPFMLSSLNKLYPLYPKPAAPEALTASTTSTSTRSVQRLSTTFVPQIDPSAPRATGFMDEIVANHSTRVLKDNSGRTVVIYGYYNKGILIIARDESAFELLVSRLITSGN